MTGAIGHEHERECEPERERILTVRTKILPTPEGIVRAVDDVSFHLDRGEVWPSGRVRMGRVFQPIPYSASSRRLPRKLRARSCSATVT